MAAIVITSSMLAEVGMGHVGLVLGLEMSRLSRSSLREGADVQRLLHHLSVYLGHAHLSGTQVYLTMTPELLQVAGSRFERYARGEDGHA